MEEFHYEDDLEGYTLTSTVLPLSFVEGTGPEPDWKTNAIWCVLY